MASIKHSFVISFLLLPLTLACIPRFLAHKESTLLLFHRQGGSLPRRSNARLFQNTVRFRLTSFGLMIPILRPFALHPDYRNFFATPASADFSNTLMLEISPEKAPKLSARAAKLYLMCLSVAVGFRVS